ncbi:MAG: trypsin-like peptidase domain-containing protein, partial [Rhodospirillales bacterium]|nr:trypsin-like peptidase domain-containing protein [Rhodospirillales bacterium]
MRRDGWKRALAGSVAALALAGGTFATMHPTQAATPVAMVEPAVAPIAGFADLVEKVKPAVVNISTTQKVERPRKNMPDMPFPPGSPYDEFFRRFFQDEQARRGPSQRNALGSGFIVDAAGYVVTNNHVIGDADEITVTLNDGTEYPATIKGKDPKTDLALLKIEARQPLPNVTFAEGDGGRVGDWVIAVGNPFGLGG